MTIEQTRAILENPAVHDWAKDQYNAAQYRDCVDAMSDAQLLAAMLEARADCILNGGTP